VGIRIGDLSIDAEGRARWRSEPLCLRPAERRLLVRLAAAPHRVHTRAELCRAMGLPHPRNVDVHVARLRRAIQEAGRALVTVRRVGYRLDPERLDGGQP
jgi:DNA-binding response OmpR family regulator